MGLNLQNIQFQKVVRTTNLSIAVSGTPQVIVWESSAGQYNLFGLWNSAVNPSRVTIARAGIYTLVGNLAFAANGVGDREIYFQKNGAGIFGRQTTAFSTVANEKSTTAIVALVAGDYIELFANQTSGGALNAVATVANESPSLVVIMSRPISDPSKVDGANLY